MRRLHRRIQQLILAENIQLIISNSVNDVPEAELEDDHPKSIFGLFLFNEDKPRSKKKIWVRSNVKYLNYNALHEFGHFLFLKYIKKLNHEDKQTALDFEEILVEGMALALSYMLDVKVHPKAIEELRDYSNKRIIKRKTR